MTTTTRSLALNRAGAISSPARVSVRVIIPSDAPSESMSVTLGQVREQPALGLRAPRDARRRDRAQRREVPPRPARRRARRAAAGRTRRRRSCTPARARVRPRPTPRRRRGAACRAARPSRRPTSVDSAMNRPVPCMSGHAGRQVAARLPARDRRLDVGRLGARAAPSATATRRGRRCATSRPSGSRWCRRCRRRSGRRPTARVRRRPVRVTRRDGLVVVAGAGERAHRHPRARPGAAASAGARRRARPARRRRSAANSSWNTSAAASELSSRYASSAPT